MTKHGSFNAFWHGNVVVELRAPPRRWQCFFICDTTCPRDNINPPAQRHRRRRGWALQLPAVVVRVCMQAKPDGPPAIPGAPVAWPQPNPHPRSQRHTAAARVFQRANSARTFGARTCRQLAPGLVSQWALLPGMPPRPMPSATCLSTDEVLRSIASNTPQSLGLLCDHIHHLPVEHSITWHC